MSRLLSQTDATVRQAYVSIRERVRQLQLQESGFNSQPLDAFQKHDLEKLIAEKKRLEVMFMLKQQELPK